MNATGMSNSDSTVMPLRARPAWQALESHHKEISAAHIRDLFAADPNRGERLTAEGAGLYLDYSKNRITAETISLLMQLAKESRLQERIELSPLHDRVGDLGIAARVLDGHACLVA